MGAAAGGFFPRVFGRSNRSQKEAEESNSLLHCTGHEGNRLTWKTDLEEEDLGEWLRIFRPDPCGTFDRVPWGSFSRPRSQPAAWAVFGRPGLTAAGRRHRKRGIFGLVSEINPSPQKVINC